MKYLSTFKIFENYTLKLNAEDYLDIFFTEDPNIDYDGEKHTDIEAIRKINKLIEKLKIFKFPFDAYLLNEKEDIWTTSLSELYNYNKKNLIVKKATIYNYKDVDFEETLKGRILELDAIMTRSHYISFNKDNTKIENTSLSNLSDEIDEIVYELTDRGISVNNSLFHAFGYKDNGWHGGSLEFPSFGRDMNIFNLNIVSSYFLPIDITISSLFRLDEYLLNNGFTRDRPTHLDGALNKNISLEMVGNNYMTNIYELKEKSKTFSINFPFKKLELSYYKYIN